MRFNTALYPPKGYTFTEKDGVRISGTSWSDLFRRIADYRTANNKPVGDVEQDVHDQICEDAPGLCEGGDPGSPPPISTLPSLTFNQRILGWLGTMVGLKRDSGLKLVDRDLAGTRAAICATCEFQRSLVSGCGACENTLKTSRTLLVEKNPDFPDLKPCAVLGEDCQVSVHLELPASSEPGLPVHCWRQ